MTKRMTRAEKYAAKLAALEAKSKDELTPEEELKLAKLREKRKADSIAEADADPPAKRHATAGICTDEGAWGDNGEWVYPADKQISCSLCKSDFTFTGAEQAWYAQKKLYAPARCAACISAKKESKEAKKASGKSGAGRCFNCGESGHVSSKCPKPVAEAPAANGGRKACYVCGSDQHLSRNCPDAHGKKKAASGCFTCGSTAHMSRECPQRPPPICFNWCAATRVTQSDCSLACLPILNTLSPPYHIGSRFSSGFAFFAVVRRVTHPRRVTSQREVQAESASPSQRDSVTTRSASSSTLSVTWTEARTDSPHGPTSLSN